MAEHALEEAAARAGLEYSRAARRNLALRWAKALAAYLVLTVFAVIAIGPFVYLLSPSFRKSVELFSYPPEWFPRSFYTGNFGFVLNDTSYLRWALNTLIFATAVTVITLALDTLAGYAFARLRFPGRELLFWLVVATMFLPSMIAVPALYTILSTLDLLDTWAGLILPYTGWYLPVSVFIMRGVFTTIPKELEDAARIDGCSPVQLFWRIMLPLGISGAIVVAIFAFVPIWGEYLFSFTFTSTTNAMPMSVGIRFFEPTPATGNYTFNVATAAALIMFLPSMLVYIALQKWFTKGMLEGALKF